MNEDRQRREIASQSDASKTPRDTDVVGRIATALARLEFGTVTVTVHASKVVQIDITERQRFNA